MIIYKVINYKFNIINYYNKNIFSIKSRILKLKKCMNKNKLKKLLLFIIYNHFYRFNVVKNNVKDL